MFTYNFIIKHGYKIQAWTPEVVAYKNRDLTIEISNVKDYWSIYKNDIQIAIGYKIESLKILLSLIHYHV